MAVLKQTSPTAWPSAPRPKPSSTVPSASTRSAVGLWSGQAEAFSDVVMSALHSRKRPCASKPEGQEKPKKTGYSHAFAAYLTAGSAALDWAFLPFCKLLPLIRSRAWTQLDADPARSGPRQLAADLRPRGAR